LSEPATGPLAIEILDAQGKLVRRYASDDKPEITQVELEKQLIPLYWVRMPKALRTTPGMHRWVWDLHYPAPTATRHPYPISAVPHNTPRQPLGPHALPGNYRVRLTVNGQSFTAPLTVKMDPRVKTPPAGLQQMFELETQLASLLTTSSQAVIQAGSIREQLENLKATGAAATSIEAFRKKLKMLAEGSGKEPPPASELTLKNVNSAANTLYTDVYRVDATPTGAQVEATRTLEQDTTTVMKQWEALKTTDLPALNNVLRSAGLPEVQLEANPQAGAEQTDEE